MLAEITAVTQLVLVLEVAYLMAHCRAFKNGIPDVLDDMADRDLRTRTAFGEVASLLDEVCDGLLSEEAGIAHPPMDLKALLTSVLLSRFNPQPEHGTSEDGTIQENNEAKESETIIEHP
jgi:hypothetical protein